VSDRKTVIILRGAPGSGKSAVADLLERVAEASVVSMDRFRTDVRGNYHFDYSKLDEEALQMKTDFGLLLESEVPLIVLDNTHSRTWEYRWAITLAERKGYVVHVVEVQASFWTCLSRQTHNVPTAKVREIFDRWETPMDSTLEDRMGGLEEVVDQTLKEIDKRLVRIDDKLDELGGEDGE